MIRISIFLFCLLISSASCSGSTTIKDISAIDSEIAEKEGENVVNGGLVYFANSKLPDDIAIQNPYIMGALYTIYWSEVEREKGKYDWSEVDKFFKNWISAGKKVGIRVIWISTGLWPHEVARHPAPEWLWKDGAKYHYDEKTKTEIPLFWDPIYNEHALRLMQAIYDRYGKDPNFLFVSSTPGYETFPCHPRTAEVNPNFFEEFAQTKDSQGRAYSPELWQKTVKEWIFAVSAIYKEVLAFVSLNRGGLSPKEDYFQLFGEYAVEANAIVGQNGIKASSYLNANGGRYKLFKEWKKKVPVFQEMALASGNEERQVGTLMGVMEAAVRIDTDYLNVYAIDVLKGTKGYKDYDPTYEEALKFGYEKLQLKK